MAETNNIVGVILRGRDESASKVIRQADKDLQQLGNTSKQTTFALRQVPAQFTDIVTSLQAGQNPLQVLLQQGGQLKDMFGGIGPAARALGGYIIGLVTPVTVAIAAVVGLTAAFEAGRRESVAVNNALAVTNNYAGETASGMRALAEEITRTGNISIGTAKDIVSAYVTSGKFSSETIGLLARLTEDFARSTGEDVDKIAPKLINLFDDPVKGAEALNAQMHFLSTTNQEYIAHLVRIGELELARQVLLQETTDHIPKQAQNVGLLEKAWDLLAGAASRAWDAMKGVGRDSDLQTKLAEAKQKLAEIDPYIEAIDPGARARQQAVVDNLQQQIDKEKAIAKAKSDAAKEDERRTVWLKEIQKSEAYNLQIMQDQLKLVKSQTPANTQEAILQQTRIAELNKKILEAQGIGEKSIQEQIRSYETLRDRAIRAYEDAGDAAQKAADRAAAALAKAADIRLKTQNQVQDIQLKNAPDDEQDRARNIALEESLNKADTARKQAAYQRFLGETDAAKKQLEISDKQVANAQELASKLKDQDLAAQQIAAAGEAAAKNEEERATIETKIAEKNKQLQQDLLDQINANGARIEDLKAKMDAINASPLKVKTDDSALDATLAKLDKIQHRIDPANAANFTGVYDSNGNAIYRDPPGMATGGRVGGSGTKGVDSEPRMLDPEEHVWTSNETDDVGGHDNMYRLRSMARAGLLRRLLEGRAEHFDVGGSGRAPYQFRSAASRMSFPSLNPIKNSSGSSVVHRGNWTLSDGSTHEITASPDFFDRLVALKMQQGRRS